MALTLLLTVTVPLTVPLTLLCPSAYSTLPSPTLLGSSAYPSSDRTLTSTTLHVALTLTIGV